MRAADPPDGAPLADEATEFGARVARRLREDPVIWMTTVGPAGMPSPNPVWFLWDGARTLRTDNLPSAARVRHIAANPRVALHLDGDRRGGDIVVLTGTASVALDLPAPDAEPAYLEKYAAHITRIGHTPASFAEHYGLPIQVTLTGVRGH